MLEWHWRLPPQRKLAEAEQATGLTFGMGVVSCNLCGWRLPPRRSGSPWRLHAPLRCSPLRLLLSSLVHRVTHCGTTYSV